MPCITASKLEALERPYLYLKLWITTRGFQTGVDNSIFLNGAISTTYGCRERELAAAYSQSKELTYSLCGEHAVLPLLHYSHTKLRRAAQDFVFLQGLLSGIPQKATSFWTNVSVGKILESECEFWWQQHEISLQRQLHWKTTPSRVHQLLMASSWLFHLSEFMHLSMFVGSYSLPCITCPSPAICYNFAQINRSVCKSHNAFFFVGSNIT